MSPSPSTPFEEVHPAIPYERTFSIYEASWRRHGETIRLDSGGPLTEASRWCVLAGKPLATLRGRKDRLLLREGKRSSSPTWDSFLRRLEGDRRYRGSPETVMASAWFGVLSYEFGLIRNGLRPRHPSSWDVSFFKPGAVLVFDRRSGRYSAFGAVEPVSALAQESSGSFRAWQLRRMESRRGYQRKVEAVLDYIAAGDLYQANLSQAFALRWSGDPGVLYERLRASNPGPFMGLYRGPGFSVASTSPERLLAVHDGRMDTRPIAGTRPRGSTASRDAQLRRQLRTSPKEKAEHLMLVDLARNDLGRVAEYGTVRVSDFARVERYARVQHLVSTVEGMRRKKVRLSQMVDALFPGGTITGCPKRRCMEVLAGLEDRPRGFYTGAMGYFAPGGAMDLNILIRTLTLWDSGLLEFHAGAGIVADSKPEREYDEILHKAEALAEALKTTLARSIC